MSIVVDGAPLRGAPPPVRGLRLSSRNQSLIGVVTILLLLPIGLRMELKNFEPFTDLRIWRFLGEGVFIVLVVSAVAIVLSLPVAVALALGRLSTNLVLRALSIAFVEGIRAVPLLLLIFYVFLSMPREVSTFVGRETLALTFALLVYTAAINAETLRAGILALDRGQMEAARSLGLAHWTALRYVILPQAFRTTLPPLLAQFTTLVKDTSLGLAIGMVELLSRGRIIYQGERNPMETLYVVGLLYFAVNFILEQASLATQRGGSVRQQ
jgi:His/Glu/Gln/Arg/opine family amino acid ABC transporter permease subunit